MVFDGAWDCMRSEAALALAEAGLPVFPCGADKRPLVKWKEGATTDTGQVQDWWRRYPDALPCVPMGAASGLFAVDADIDKETGEAVGEATLATIGVDAAAHPHAARTRSGGAHLFFRWVEGLPGNSVKGTVTLTLWRS